MFFKKRKIFGMFLIIMWGWALNATAELQGSRFAQPDAVHENKQGIHSYNSGFYDHLPHGRKAEATHEFVQAEKAFKKAIEIDSNYVEAHRNLARLYFVQKKFNDSAAEYSKVIELAPYDLETYVCLARVQLKLGNFTRAIEYLELVKTKTENSQKIQRLNEYIEKIKQVEQPTQ
ncbi:tetratricopeptide repeat protein [Desulforhopalus singaporensis]|uniref:Tetratricopeptide repeat-containing protein n=1 Tax=Desulforhopalus singaporensis TaxID=91360 RepID=A0A1H0PRA1_9BACT|nr:tetratricopeptide repeat protein [Desulforhopalus singaporensis]SDP07089.1 Tetratricopeptide repeat-containing protein [Desulforhopalus singaporensis]